MSAGEGGQVFFALGFSEAIVIYAMLFERKVRLPSQAEIMDEIERQELYPLHRKRIPKALDMVEDLTGDMREYLLAFGGELIILELENDIQATVKKSKEKRT